MGTEAWRVWSEPDGITFILMSSFLKWSYFLRNWLSAEDSSQNECKPGTETFHFDNCQSFVPGHVTNCALQLRKEAITLTSLLIWWFCFCFQKNENNCDKAIAEVVDHISRQKAVEEKVLNDLLDQMKVDQEILGKQKLALNEEAQRGLTQVNCFLQEDLKVDIPTGI